jgi:hypothetical protein
MTSYTGREFLQHCHMSGTDKCNVAHAYQFALSRYLTPLRHRHVRLFEIGLGCNMHSRGASFRLWTSFFPNLDLHILEIDRACAEAWYAELSLADQGKVTLHFGDQSNVLNLLAIMKATTQTALFDVIIDDGVLFC